MTTGQALPAIEAFGRGSAEETARAILDWARQPTGHAPRATLRELETLIAPGGRTVASLQRLACEVAARLGAGDPPLGDRAPIGLGALFLAAAIGGRHRPSDAERLAAAAPAPSLSHWRDLLARHAVLAPFLAMPAADHAISPAPLEEALIVASPLTTVLCRPAARQLVEGTVGAGIDTARRLVSRPHGRAMLSRRMAVPERDPVTLNWRAHVLSQLTLDRVDVVLDTYVTARVTYGEEWDRHVRWATRELCRPELPDEAPLAIVRFFVPLALLARRQADLVRVRPYLTGFGRAIRLAEQYRLTTRIGAEGR
ncbi:hypothetical protein J5X84_15570 [Streptosporangiaceae bacterium NEAU-GS5]|nr:hypothetical protein [Streptosporangiaceae bacterium NEAU-GS5]